MAICLKLLQFGSRLGNARGDPRSNELYRKIRCGRLATTRLASHFPRRAFAKVNRGTRALPEIDGNRGLFDRLPEPHFAICFIADVREVGLCLSTESLPNVAYE